MEQGIRYEHLSTDELVRRREIALGTIAEIAANLDNGHVPSSSRQELEASSDLFHGDVEAYELVLAERGTNQ